MSVPYRTLLVVSRVAVLAIACGTRAGGDDTAPASPPPAEGSSNPGQVRLPDGTAVRLVGEALEVVLDGGATVQRWTLGGGETFHSFLVHPVATADSVDAVALALDGDRPLLYYVSARPGGASGIARFPEHLQPAQGVDAVPSALAWTPDGRSLVWTEPSSDGMVLRAIGWEVGPGTGRPADDNATFRLDASGSAQVDGFEVTSGLTWTLILRGGGSDGPIEVLVERQPDGASAWPLPDEEPVGDAMSFGAGCCCSRRPTRRPRWSGASTRCATEGTRRRGRPADQHRLRRRGVRADRTVPPVYNLLVWPAAAYTYLARAAPPNA